MLRIIIALMLLSLLTRSVASSGELDGHVSQYWLMRTENSHTDLDVTYLLHHHVRRLVKSHTYRICENSTSFTLILSRIMCEARYYCACVFHTACARAGSSIARARAHVDCFSNLHVCLCAARFFQTQQACSKQREAS